MAVRFKFRSSVNFDSVDIEGRTSISVRDLKSKIVRHKNLDICQDFDLVFSDALTGQEYTDEKFQIPSGSSVIIKRVPAGSVPSHRAHFNSFENVQNKDNKDNKMVNSTLPANVEVDDFDDFGVELYPVPEATLSGADLDTDNNVCIGSDRKNSDVARYFEPPRGGCQKLEESDVSEASPRGPGHSGIEGNTSQAKSKLKVEEDTNLEKVVDANPTAMQNADLLSELNCSLCDSFFKEAVMIPCCQHSFCEKCIRLVLLEKARCPKCFSKKCRVEDLLPNVSLRQAIEHFLENQILTTGSGNAFHRYAPDGESGIQAKDVSCGVTIFQREPEPHSPSATGRGSNQIMAESAYDSLIRKNTSFGGIGSRIKHLGGNDPLKPPPSSHKINQIDGEGYGSSLPVDKKRGHEDLAAFDDFQGESQPMHEEAESNLKKKRGFWVNNTAGRDKGFVETPRHKKGDRACYMCGSLDHFIRDCPAASSPHPMLQTGSAMFPGAMQGYVSPYWCGTPLPHVRPYANLYGNSGTIPFNATMVPATPFAVPAYMPSMYGGFPAYNGYMRMKGVAPPLGAIAERHLTHPEFLDFHFESFEKRQKLSNEKMRRELSFDGDEDDDLNKRCSYNKTERSGDHKSRINKEKSISYSECSFTQKSQMKHSHDNQRDDDNSVDVRHEKDSHSSIAVRDQKSCRHPERSSSEVEDVPSSSNWHSRERHKHHHGTSKKHNERRDKCGSDSSWSHRQTNKEKEVEMKRGRSDVKRHNHKRYNHSGSGLEHSLSSDKKKQQKKTSHSSRYSKHNAKSTTDEPSHDRWQMVSGSDEDGREEYCSYKRKRVH